MPSLHPWHEVPAGPRSPEIVNALIEIPRGSRVKYEIDKVSGLLRLDRVLYSSMMYPAHYGFIPQTMGEDGDPFDIMVLTQVDVQALCLVECKVIGAIRMIDGGIPDEKIIAVPTRDMSVSEINSMDDLPKHFLKELRTFFEDYTNLEGKHVEIEGFPGKEDATGLITSAMKRYQQKWGVK